MSFLIPLPEKESHMMTDAWKEARAIRRYDRAVAGVLLAMMAFECWIGWQVYHLRPFALRPLPTHTTDVPAANPLPVEPADFIPATNLPTTPKD